MCNVIDVETQNNLEYLFIPVSSSVVRLQVKAGNDVHVALTYGKFERDPMTELRIGGWGNTKSSVRRDRKKPDKVEVNTPGILNREEYIAIWVRWNNNYIATGLEGSPTPFMAYKDPCPHPINHIGIRTGFGASASWKIEVSPVLFKRLTPKPLGGKLRWVSMTSNDEVPAEAVVGGFEKGEVLFVARAPHGQSVWPGKYVPSLKTVLISCQNRVYRKDTFEILCGENLSWVETKEERLPPHAFPGGTCFERNNEVLYIGRAFIQNDLVPGAVSLACKACCIPYGNPETEIIENTFEVLVLPEKMPKKLIWHAPKKRRRESSVTVRRNMLLRRRRLLDM